MGLKGRLFPCLGVEQSLQLCPVLPHPQHFISFLSLFGFWNLMDEYLPFPLLDLESLCPLFLLEFWLVWLVMADIRSAIFWVSTSYDGSELSTFTCKAISVHTTADLALASDRLLLGVADSAFLTAITN